MKSVGSSFNKTKREDGVGAFDAMTATFATPKPLKRTATGAGVTATPDEHQPPTKKPRTLTPQAHDDLPKGAVVHLRPSIDLSATGTISGVTISSLQRTPSPFGAKMGDHTVSWQGHVDSVRARLHGKTIDDATTTVEHMQTDAQQWMENPDSFGMSLFNLLPDDDADRRTPRLEDAAYQVQQFCTEARSKADPSEAAGELSKAVAQHLAFKNYLPFSTVPAATARGSKGSGEGTHRNNLVDFEDGRRLAEKDMKPEQRQAEQQRLAKEKPDGEFLSDSLWHMFAFDAALRESNIEYALDPGLLSTFSADCDVLRNVVESLRGMMTMAGKDVPLEVLQVLELQVGDVANRQGQDAGIAHAARTLRDNIAVFRSTVPKAYSAAGKQRIAELREAVPSHVREADDALETIKKTVRDAPQRAADVLAYLLHEHQETMAPSFAHAVIASGFLPLPDATSRTADADLAAQAAIDQLEKALREEYPGLFKDAEPAKLDDVRKALRARYLELPPIVVPETTDWVEHAKNADLVVTYAHGAVPAFTVNGRAPAPGGITGMGCHTTAWAIEQQHPDAIVHGSKTAAQALGKLRDAMLKDARSAVMKLDASLPLDQIEAGQVTSAYDAALEVLLAADVGAAATAYLTFRNLLPYATVNTGNRDGHAEKMDGDQKSTYDGRALREAAELKDVELAASARLDPVQAERKRNLLKQAADLEADDDLAGAADLRKQAEKIQVDSERLRAAATELASAAQRVLDAAPTGTGRQPYTKLRTAINESADRMTTMATKVATGTPPQPVGPTILTARQAEHKKVWTEVQEFRKHL